MRKLVKGLAGVLSAGVLSLLAAVIYVQATLPDDFYVAQGEELYINSMLSISPADDQVLDAMIQDSEGNSYSLNLKLFQSVPVKQVQVQVVPRKMVVPGGNPFGIKMFTDGVMIVGMSDIQVGSENLSPAKDAGLKIGDILLSIDGNPLYRNEDVAHYISQSGGDEVIIEVVRGGITMEVYLQPILSEYDNGYKAGIWVRDSSAGIGTMTYYDPQTLGFAGLGHAICDVDTGNLMPLSTGEIVDVNISGVSAGMSGKPGELKGSFVSNEPLGRLYVNSDMGIFGVLSKPLLANEPVPMAHKQEIQPGPAAILSTISGNKPQSFAIEIEKVNYSDTTNTKNMVIKITDPKLLTSTGGIVQGMSGSPILQDGKLVGAVTHVFVNDPTRGYGIFAENMDNQLNRVESTRKIA